MLKFHAEMALNITTSTSLSQNNYNADVAPEVDTGTRNPHTGFSSLFSVPPEKFWDNTSNYSAVASFPTFRNKDNEEHKTNQEEKIKK
jgi:hypothetical protein